MRKILFTMSNLILISGTISFLFCFESKTTSPSSSIYELYKNGNFIQITRKFKNPTNFAEKYILAVALKHTKNFSNSAELLEEVKRENPIYELLPFIEFHMAECELELGKTNLALSRLTNILTSYPDQKAVCEILSRITSGRQKLKFLKNLYKLKKSPPLAFQIAELTRRFYSSKEAVPWYEKVLSSSYNTRHLKTSLKRVLPVKKLTRQQIKIRVRASLLSGRWDYLNRFLKIYKARYGEDEFFLRNKIRYLSATGKKKTALKMLNAFLKKRLKFWAVRMKANLLGRNKGISFLERTAKKSSWQMKRKIFRLITYKLLNSNTEKAVKIISMVVKKSNRWEDINLFLKGIKVLIYKRRFSLAEKLLEKLLHDIENPNHKTIVLYYLALVKEQKGKNAENLWKEIAETNPVSYYGIIAFKKLKRRWNPFEFTDEKAVARVEKHLKEVKERFKRTSDFAESSNIQTALKLAKYGLFVESQMFVRRALRKKFDLSEFVICNESLLKAIGMYGLLNRVWDKILLKLTKNNKFRLNIKFLTKIFPDYYKELVNEASSRFEIEKEFLFAVIKAESDFERKAVSRAGAVGLTQIMPLTARWLARKMKVKQYDLFSAYDNVMMGSFYIKDLIKRFGDERIAIAGYNAGEGAVKRWLKKYKGVNLDLFVELIPYTETRIYVKRVFFYWQMYKCIFNCQS